MKDLIIKIFAFITFAAIIYTCILLLLYGGEAECQWDEWDWFSRVPPVVTVPAIDTTYPLSAYDTSGYASFDGVNDFLYYSGGGDYAKPLEIKFATTDSFKIGFWIMLKSFTSRVLFGKVLAHNNAGYYVRYDGNSNGGKDISLCFHPFTTYGVIHLVRGYLR